MEDLASVAWRIVGEASGLLRDIVYDKGLGEIIGYGASHDTTRRADIIVEDYIIDRLKHAGLDVIIVTEERGVEHLSNNPEYIAVIDPLDGSLNYVSRIPVAAVSLVFYDIKQPYLSKALAGAVANIFLNEVYVFDREHVYVNGKRYVVEEGEFGGLISIYTENPIFLETVREYVMREYRVEAKIRTLGSAAIESAYAALNRIDLFLHNTGRLRNFDVAGGAEIAYRLSVPVLSLNRNVLEGVRMDRIEKISSIAIGLHADRFVEKIKSLS